MNIDPATTETSPTPAAAVVNTPAAEKTPTAATKAPVAAGKVPNVAAPKKIAPKQVATPKATASKAAPLKAAAPKTVTTKAAAPKAVMSKPVAAKPAAKKLTVGQKPLTKQAAPQPAAAPKPATQPTAKKAGKPAARKASVATVAADAKAPKLKPNKAAPQRAQKIKMVRDSFTFPADEHKRLVEMKKRLIALGTEVKKGELVRAGLDLLVAMDDAKLLKAVAGVERLKTGRPKK